MIGGLRRALPACLLAGVGAAGLLGAGLLGAGTGIAQNAPANAVGASQTPNSIDAILTPDAPPPAVEAPPAVTVTPADTAELPNEIVPAPPALRPTPDANVMANATLNEIAPAEPPPPKRPRYATAVLQALDKVTAETLRFEVKVNEPVRYKDLVITVHACETQASDEVAPVATAQMEVQYQPEGLATRGPPVARQVFRGWMFGDSPGLHPFEHPIYDLWMVACKSPAPGATPSTDTTAVGANL